jgi:hypothetical protein
METSAIIDWPKDTSWPMSRKGKEFKGISEEYIRSVAGTLSGGMARLNPEYPTLFSMLSKLEDFGSGIEEIQKEAENKADVFSRT